MIKSLSDLPNRLRAVFDREQRLRRLKSELVVARSDLAGVRQQLDGALRSNAEINQHRRELQNKTNGQVKIITAMVIQMGGEISLPRAVISDLDVNPAVIAVENAAANVTFRLVEQRACGDCGATILAGDRCESCIATPFELVTAQAS